MNDSITYKFETLTDLWHSLLIPVLIGGRFVMTKLEVDVEKESDHYSSTTTVK